MYNKNYKSPVKGTSYLHDYKYRGDATPWWYSWSTKHNWIMQECKFCW